MKTGYIVLAAALWSVTASAAEWRNLDDAHHYSGPKVTAESLVGKVVMVDEWGVNCPPCRALLPRMEEIWTSFRSKPFVLLGSHRQGNRPDEVKALVKANKLTYPIYDACGLAEGEPANGGAIPFIYVLNHRGKVVYSGRSEREATQAVVEAITVVGLPPEIAPGAPFGKYYKGLQKKFRLGASIKGDVARLKKDIEAAAKKSATAVQKDKAREAKAILAALKEGLADCRAEIEHLRRTKPAEVGDFVKKFIATFPEEGAAYKEVKP